MQVHKGSCHDYIVSIRENDDGGESFSNLNEERMESESKQRAAQRAPLMDARFAANLRNFAIMVVFKEAFSAVVRKYMRPEDIPARWVVRCDPWLRT